MQAQLTEVSGRRVYGATTVTLRSMDACGGMAQAVAFGFEHSTSKLADKSVVPKPLASKTALGTPRSRSRLHADTKTEAGQQEMLQTRLNRPGISPRRAKLLVVTVFGARLTSQQSV